MSAVLPSNTAATARSTDPASVPLSKPADTSKAETVASAVARLAVSRERLRSAMLPTRREASGSIIGDGIGALAGGLVERLRASPGTAVIIDAIQEWWAKHPLRMAGAMAAEAARRLAGPVAERRPLTLVFGAVFVGALLALLRPWRLLLRPAVFAGLLPAIALRVMRELPTETWLRAVTRFASPPPADAAAPSTVAADGPEVGTPLAPSAEVGTAGRAVPPVGSADAVRREPSTVYP
jgi:hypothetical protein